MTPRVSVIFVNYRSHDLLQRAVASLRKTHPPDLVEIVVVDNGSPEPLPAFPEAWQVRTLRLRRNVGYGPAVNLAARYATGTYLVAANPDLEFRDQEVIWLARYLDEHPEVGAVIPQYVNPVPGGGVRKQPSARRFHRIPYVLFGRISPLSHLWPENRFTREFLALETLRAAGPVEIEVAVGAFLMVRRSLFEELGGFDPDFFLFSEDSDLCYRIWQAGYRVVLLPQVELLHHHGAVRRRVRARPRYWRMKAVLLFLRKHGRFPAPVHALLGLGFAFSVALYLFLEAWEVVFQ